MDRKLRLLQEQGPDRDPNLAPNCKPVNLKTAKTLGLTLPPSILARADEVIE